MSATVAEQLVETPLEHRCLAELRAASGETGGGMERHCVGFAAGPDPARLTL